MSWIPDRRAKGLLLCLGAAVAGCGFDRPADPPPFDCARIDRAAERFPAECAALEDLDAGASPDAPVAEEDGGAR